MDSANHILVVELCRLCSSGCEVLAVESVFVSANFACNYIGGGGGGESKLSKLNCLHSCRSGT